MASVQAARPPDQIPNADRDRPSFLRFFREPKTLPQIIVEMNSRQLPAVAVVGGSQLLRLPVGHARHVKRSSTRAEISPSDGLLTNLGDHRRREGGREGGREEGGEKEGRKEGEGRLPATCSTPCVGRPCTAVAAAPSLRWQEMNGQKAVEQKEQ